MVYVTVLLTDALILKPGLSPSSAPFITLSPLPCPPSQVNQRNVPGIDNAYLAMDTEEGVEVVWNEVMFSER